MTSETRSRLFAVALIGGLAVVTAVATVAERLLPDGRSSALQIVPGLDTRRPPHTLLIPHKPTPLMRPSLLLFALFACVPVRAQPVPDTARVERLLARTPLVDGHNDLLRYYMECEGCPRGFDGYDLADSTSGDTDIRRLRAGGVGVQFLNVFGPEYSARSTLDGFDLVLRFPERYPETFGIAGTAAEARAIHAAGRIALVPTIEYAVRLENSPAILRLFHRLGLRAVTLAYATNDLADGSDDAPRHGGLSTLGAEMVREMNRIGVLVDLSHVSAETMHDVLDLATAPVIFTHSSARALCDVNRNVPDDVLRRLPDNGGVVMVSFVPYFTTQANADWFEVGNVVWDSLGTTHGDDQAARIREMQAWEAAHPEPPVTVADVADHVEHVRRVAGIDHVGIGSDFDGIDFKVRGLEDASTFPVLLEELARRGWADEELRKVAGENALRVLEAAERIAADAPRQ